MALFNTIPTYHQKVFYKPYTTTRAIGKFKAIKSLSPCTRRSQPIMESPCMPSPSNFGERVDWHPRPFQEVGRHPLEPENSQRVFFANRHDHAPWVRSLWKVACISQWPCISSHGNQLQLIETWVIDLATSFWWSILGLPLQCHDAFC